MSVKQPRRNKPPVGKQGPIRRRASVVSDDKQLYNLCVVVNNYALTQFVKKFSGGGLGEVPFSNGTSPSNINKYSIIKPPSTQRSRRRSGLLRR